MDTPLARPRRTCGTGWTTRRSCTLDTWRMVGFASWLPLGGVGGGCGSCCGACRGTRGRGVFALMLLHGTLRCRIPSAASACPCPCSPPAAAARHPATALTAARCRPPSLSLLFPAADKPLILHYGRLWQVGAWKFQKHWFRTFTALQVRRNQPTNRSINRPTQSVNRSINRINRPQSINQPHQCRAAWVAAPCTSHQLRAAAPAASPAAPSLAAVSLPGVARPLCMPPDPLPQGPRARAPRRRRPPPPP